MIDKQKIIEKVMKEVNENLTIQHTLGPNEKIEKAISLAIDKAEQHFEKELNERDLMIKEHSDVLIAQESERKFEDKIKALDLKKEDWLQLKKKFGAEKE